MSHTQITFQVKETLGPNLAMEATGSQLTAEGMTLLSTASLLEQHRFMWLEFQLPGQSGPLKALAEVVHRNQDEVRVRFKHLFPDHRSRLAAFLATQVSMN